MLSGGGDGRRHRWETHGMTLSGMEEKREKQCQQQGWRGRDAVYAGMLHYLKRTRAMVRDSIGGASAVSAGGASFDPDQG